MFLGGYRVLRKGLTPEGVAHSWLLGTSLFAAFGLGGYLLVCLYFLLGTTVSLDAACLVAELLIHSHTLAAGYQAEA